MKNLECIFQKLDRPYAITMAPRKRNREFIRDGKIDGFLLSLPNSELDSFAVPTQPLVLERWNFFNLRSSSTLTQSGSSSVGAVLGSNEHIWLEKNEFEAITPMPNLTSLVKVLAENRIAYALADEQAFRAAAESASIPFSKFDSAFVRYVPLVTYFSKNFVIKNPAFLDHFNHAIGLCLKHYKQSNMMEKLRLSQLAISILDKINEKPNLEKVISNIPQDERDVSDNAVLDLQWKKAAQRGDTTPLIENFLQNTLSQLLKDIAFVSKGKIIEIFAFDDRGYIMGLNRATSDFWQGDESAYQALFVKNRNIHYSPIEFDLSTRTFEIQVSLPIFDPKSGKKIAGITIGFDADVTLSAYKL